MKHLFGKIAWGFMIAAISFCLPIFAAITLAEKTQVRDISSFRQTENSKEPGIEFLNEIFHPFLNSFLN